MEEMREILSWFLIFLPIAAAPRAAYCLLKISHEREQADVYKRRLRNLLLFVAIGESICGLLYVVNHYYGLTIDGVAGF